MDNGEVFMKLMHLATQNQIAVKFVPFTVSYARLKGNPQGMRMGISQNLQTIEEVNYNLAHELAHAYLHYDKGDTAYMPPVKEEVKVTTERQISPGVLEFSFVDTGINIGNGDPVRFKDADGKEVFYGFIFRMKRDRSNIVTITAYDQIRYLKNKDTLVYENKTADGVVALIGEKYGFNIGTLANTVWVIASRVEDNVSLLDMISNALDQTLQNTGDLYILHDDFGKLNLSFLGDMYVPTMIDAETGQNYDYESSIDENTYNRIKLVYDNEDAGKREVYIAQDSSNINRWGILQYFDALQKGENGQAKADALLQLYNKETRTLTVKDAAGDSRVRGGSLVVVQLDLGDVKLQNLMLVEKCVHKYGESKHTMDLTVSGGDFSA